MPAEKKRAPRNRTIVLTERDAEEYGRELVRFGPGESPGEIENAVICGDAFAVLGALPEKRFDLLFADPPYNLSKSFGRRSFRRTSLAAYEEWFDSWLSLCVPLLKPEASVYICGDWRSAAAIQRVGMKHFKLRNRVTWEREKGRGAKRNWKNASEDIWFFTVSDEYFFDAEAVRLKRRVIAPYRENGRPKDWEEGADGNFRLTAPSNLWTDLSVPFWSMPENTDHPTQKPEKLLAKILLASTRPGDLVLDPFAGSGTTAAAARKLDRRYVCIEEDERYCLLAAKRLAMAETDRTIQGLADGVFWERNSRPYGEQ